MRRMAVAVASALAAIAVPPPTSAAMASTAAYSRQATQLFDLMFPLQLFRQMQQSVAKDWFIRSFDQQPANVQLEKAYPGLRDFLAPMVAEESLRLFERRFPELRAAIATNNDATFTKAEMDQLVAFFRSSAGQKAQRMVFESPETKKLSYQFARTGNLPSTSDWQKVNPLSRLTPAEVAQFRATARTKAGQKLIASNSARMQLVVEMRQQLLDETMQTMVPSLQQAVRNYVASHPNPDVSEPAANPAPSASDSSATVSAGEHR